MLFGALVDLHVVINSFVAEQNQNPTPSVRESGPQFG